MAKPKDMSVNGHPLTAAHINTAETNDVNMRGQSLLFLHYIIVKSSHLKYLCSHIISTRICTVHNDFMKSLDKNG